METMTPPICGFWGDYRFLSNFWDSRVTYDGASYPTVEHAYQAAKTYDLQERAKIRAARSAGVAKRMGRRVTLRKDWESVKTSVMLELLQVKFRKGSDLAQKLLDTGDAYLEETNDWGDIFWGVCNGRGKNMLGVLLMGIRDQLRVD